MRGLRRLRGGWALGLSLSLSLSLALGSLWGCSPKASRPSTVEVSESAPDSSESPESSVKTTLRLPYKQSFDLARRKITLDNAHSHLRHVLAEVVRERNEAP